MDELVKQIDAFIEKQTRPVDRVYLLHGEVPPQGKQVYEGSRGGRYYLANTLSDRHGKTKELKNKKRGKKPVEQGVLAIERLSDLSKKRARWHNLVSLNAKAWAMQKHFPSARNNEILQEIGKRLEQARKEHREAKAVFEIENRKKAERKAKKEQLVPRDESPIATSLRNGEIKETTSLGGGCNVSLILHFKDGTKGVWKPASGEEAFLRGSIKHGTYYKREVAAFKLCQLLDFDYCPEVVIREHNGDVGSVMKFVDGAQTKPKILNVKSKEDIENMAFYNAVMGNTDRHGGNWLLKDGRPIAIDHGLAFPIFETRFYLSKFVANVIRVPIPNRLINKAQELKNNKALVEYELKPYLEPKAIKVMWDRVDKIINTKSYASIHKKW